MSFYIYRNFTVENLFKGLEATYSGYGDISELPDTEKFILWFYLPPITVKQNDLLNEIVDYQGKFQLLFNQIPTDKTFIAFTIDTLYENIWENGDIRLKNAIQGFNAMLYGLAAQNPNLKVVDFSDFKKSVDIPLLDWRYYYISQSLITPKLNQQFKTWFSTKLDAIIGKRKKCLVLDLDNTMWGGILGEDGIEGIKIGDTYPGAAFRDFQQSVLEAANNGVILAVCSKNNEDDVLEAWVKHPNMLIKQQHIAAYRINWQDKASNIEELADELNIGLDSLVFIDDNPAERERVKQMLPSVTVPDFPSQPYLMLPFFKDVYQHYFQVHQLTREDKNKTAQYTANAERNAVKKAFQNVDEYLSSLEMELDVQFANQFNSSRVAQMTQKTNQFNLTTQRYTDSDIQTFVDQNALVSCLAVKDKFGDNGITVAAIVTANGNTATIDSFLLSCRILGRGIETAYLDYLINLLHERGITTLCATYIPSSKNKQTALFYDKNGFSILSEDENGTKNYRLYITQKRAIKTYYKFKILETND